ncbi:MAG TPA: hypothetical protein VG246_06745, partial [Acidimicrobiales bacterium]|nr:hypothetical protein [Acidimicrobiales bacterium]
MNTNNAVIAWTFRGQSRHGQIWQRFADGKLIYTAIASLDGYVEDTDGSFCWSVPDEELLRFISDLERPIGTYLCGRRMCETMVYGRASNKT